MGRSASGGVKCLSRPHGRIRRQEKFRRVENGNGKDGQQDQLPSPNVNDSNEKDHDSDSKRSCPHPDGNHDQTWTRDKNNDHENASKQAEKTLKSSDLRQVSFRCGKKRRPERSFFEATN